MEEVLHNLSNVCCNKIGSNMYRHDCSLEGHSKFSISIVDVVVTRDGWISGLCAGSV